MSDDEPCSRGRRVRAVNDDELAAAAEEIEQDISAIARASATSTSTSPSDCRPTSRTTGSRRCAGNTEVVEHASARLVGELLPVLDACDTAIVHGVDGVEPICTRRCSDVLQKEGLEVIPTDGEPFDPNQHEAVLHEPADDDDAEPTVSEMLRTGYTWKGKVLRPAMVKVRG